MYNNVHGVQVILYKERGYLGHGYCTAGFGVLFISL